MYLCEGKEKACTNVMASKISVYQSDSFVMYQCDEKIFFSKCTFVLAHPLVLMLLYLLIAKNISSPKKQVENHATKYSGGEGGYRVYYGQGYACFCFV